MGLASASGRLARSSYEERWAACKEHHTPVPQVVEPGEPLGEPVSRPQGRPEPIPSGGRAGSRARGAIEEPPDCPREPLTSIVVSRAGTKMRARREGPGISGSATEPIREEVAETCGSRRFRHLVVSGGWLRPPTRLTPPHTPPPAGSQACPRRCQRLAPRLARSVQSPSNWKLDARHLRLDEQLSRAGLAPRPSAAASDAACDLNLRRPGNTWLQTDSRPLDPDLTER